MSGKAKDRINYADIWIGKYDIKAIFEVAINTITRLEQSDADFPKKNADGKFNLLECIRYFKNAQNKKATTTTDAKLRLLELQSKKLELQIREQENQLVEIDHVKDTIQKITQKIKQTLEQLPRKISKKTENRSEMEIEVIAKDVIAGEIQKLLKEMDNVQGE